MKFLRDCGGRFGWGGTLSPGTPRAGWSDLPPPSPGWEDREWDPPMDIPANRAEARYMYGCPGATKLDKKWAREFMVVAKDLPIPQGKLYIHRYAEPFLREALARCVQNGSIDYITKIGAFNFRRQRHRVDLPLSYHAYGVAADIRPPDNKAMRGTAPEPWSEEWMRTWPNGVPKELVDAWESVGWTWGGRWRRHCDPMHFQLVR